MDPTVYTLKRPVQFGSETVSELKLNSVARAFKGFKLKTWADGATEYDAYAAAECAMRMAGRPTALLDLLSSEDMNGLAQVALDFFINGQTAGNAA